MSSRFHIQNLCSRNYLCQFYNSFIRNTLVLFSPYQQDRQSGLLYFFIFHYWIHFDKIANGGKDCSFKTFILQLHPVLIFPSKNLCWLVKIIKLRLWQMERNQINTYNQFSQQRYIHGEDILLADWQHFWCNKTETDDLVRILMSIRSHNRSTHG